MEYHEAVGRLERLRRVRPKLGTETTAALLDHLGNPHADLTAVQVAGSNGKGSTARVLDRILRESGRTVGCYTSPDLNDLRERATVCGRPVPKAEVVRFVEAVWPFVVDRGVEATAPTFFEAVTALALWHFGREDIDVAVLEVGIGGRYDATSVVDPVASAVTSVSLEHTDILGETVEEIARDKATVAPASGPLVTGATGTALATIRETSDVVTVGGPQWTGSGEADPADAGSPDVLAEETGMVTLTQSELALAGDDWDVVTETPLLGQHQAVNAGIAAALARQVGAWTGGPVVTESTIAAGIRNVSWPGRFEVVEREPLTVLDGAHNPAACATLSTVVERFDYDGIHLVFGAMRDKDHREMYRALPAAERVYLAAPEVKRAQDTDTLAAAFEAARDAEADVEQCQSVLAAVDRALRAAGPGDCVLVTGSLYTVGAARDRWTRTPTVVRTDTADRARAVMEHADVPAGTRRDRANRMVGETVRFHARRRVARDIRERMYSLGGSCAVSGVEAADGHVQVVLSGTREQFLALVREFRECAGELRHLATQLNDALGVGVDRATSDYPWAEGTAVMGIVNVTPDSFHDGGEYDETDEAVARARRQVANGAAIVDVGGESTRPGAAPVAVAEERDRVVPVVERLDDFDVMVSVDTRKPTVASAALDAGADMVNDVTGLADAAMRRVVAEAGVPAVCMHSLSAPVDPGLRYDYGDVVSDVLDALTERVVLAERAGIDRSDLLVDPGLGFGKRASESFELLDRLGEFRALGGSVMVGHSHKSMFRDIATDPEDRFAATVAATALAADRGADVVRVHDVPPNVDAVATAAGTTGEH